MIYTVTLDLDKCQQIVQCLENVRCLTVISCSVTDIQCVYSRLSCGKNILTFCTLSTDAEYTVEDMVKSAAI